MSSQQHAFNIFHSICEELHTSEIVFYLSNFKGNQMTQFVFLQPLMLYMYFRNFGKTLVLKGSLKKTEKKTFNGGISSMLTFYNKYFRRG